MDLQGIEDNSPIKSNFSSAIAVPTKNSAGTAILGELSQELRSPLNNILGFASLLKEKTLSESDREQFLDRILSNGDHLLQLLDDATQFSKIEKGEVLLEKVNFNISDMVYDVAEALKSAADKKDLGIHITFKTAIPRTITSDPLKMRQILSNILGSMIRAAEGDGFILVSLLFEDAQLKIKMDDSAAGVSDGKTLTAAQKISRIESSFNAASEILHPGLALSRKFAEALGGSLDVTASELGNGDCFVLKIPAADLGDVEFLNKKKIPSILERFSTKLVASNRLMDVKILLAEDSSDSETLIRFYLKKEGAKLTHVHNGLEAIEAVKSQQFDVILMDIQMPLLDGLEATRQIRELGFQKPIIALTGETFRNDAEKSLKAGCDTHMTKPVQKEILVSELQKRTGH